MMAMRMQRIKKEIATNISAREHALWVSPIVPTTMTLPRKVKEKEAVAKEAVGK